MTLYWHMVVGVCTSFTTFIHLRSLTGMKYNLEKNQKFLNFQLLSGLIFSDLQIPVEYWQLKPQDLSNEQFDLKDEER